MEKIKAIGRYFAALVRDLMMVVGRFAGGEIDLDDALFLIHVAEVLRRKSHLVGEEKEALSTADAVLKGIAEKMERSPEFSDRAQKAFQGFVTETMQYVETFLACCKDDDVEARQEYADVVLFYRGILECARVWAERNGVDFGAQPEYGFDDEIAALVPRHAGNKSRVEHHVVASSSRPSECFFLDKAFLPEGDYGAYLAAEAEREADQGEPEPDEEQEEVAAASDVEECVDDGETIEEFIARMEKETEISQEESDEISACTQALYEKRVREREEREAIEYGMVPEAEDEEVTVEAQTENPVATTASPKAVPASSDLTLFHLEPKEHKKKAATRTRANSEAKAVREEKLQEAENAQELLPIGAVAELMR